MACRSSIFTAYSSALFTAVISIVLWFWFPNTLTVRIGDNLNNFIPAFLVGGYAADLPTNENLRNATIQFYTSLVPGANVTWYSNLLSILFCVHLASFCVRFIGAQRAAKRICCTTTRLCARCKLSGTGILTMLVLHSCYGRPSLDFW